MKKPIYVGIFLDEKSKQSLLTTVPPLHKNVHADHLTLAFGKAMKAQYDIGSTVEFQVVGVTSDELGQAVSVCPDALVSLLAGGQNPHITISCADGVAPKYSNELLIKSPSRKISLFLSGTIDYYPRNFS